VPALSTNTLPKQDRLTKYHKPRAFPGDDDRLLQDSDSF
jgi:hypothetical protein